MVRLSTTINPMGDIKNKITKHIYPLILFAVTALLFITNYKHGYYLSGWDNIQTDLSPVLGIKRAFYGVWQEYQSFGLPAGLAHPADLVRALWIWIADLFLPQHLIRWVYHIAMLAIGSIGMYQLLVVSGLTVKKKIYAFVGGLFYLLNFATIQIFYVPFEAFSHFYAFLPWLIIAYLTILNGEATKRNLFAFILVNILASPAWYIQTNFVVYGLTLGIITIVSIASKKSIRDLPKVIALGLLILAINAFWILPQLYFLRTSGSVVTDNKMNQLATDDLYYQNLEKGTFKNFLTMQGFYVDLSDIKNNPLFAPWKEYFGNLGIIFVLYILSITSYIGIFAKSRFRAQFIALLILCALALLNATLPFSLINQLIRQNRFINEIFRIPFTKFIVLYAFVVSYFIAYSASYIGVKLKRQTLIAGLFIALIVTQAVPAFKGNLFATDMKVKIPTEYSELFEYFKSQNPNSRIALLPDHTFWGWYFTRWGYNGSGFIWYGIEQPIVSRTFDVWSKESESYFWQIKQAVDSENIDELTQITRKYDIDYFVLDKSLLPVSATLRGIQYDRIVKMLSRIPGARIVKSGKYIDIYSISSTKKTQDFISVGKDLPISGPTLSIQSIDPAYESYGEYSSLESPKSTYDRYWPFVNLTTATEIPDKTWSLNEYENEFILSKKSDVLVADKLGSALIASREAQIFQDNRVKKYKITAKLSVKNNQIEVKIPKELVKKIPSYLTTVDNCGATDITHPISSNVEEGGLAVSVHSGAIACFSYSAPELEQRYGYIIKVKTKNITGRRPYFYILDQTRGQSFLEARLIDNVHHFILPPTLNSGRGYAFTFQLNSYANLQSEDIIDPIEIYTFPYKVISEVYFDKGGITPLHGTFTNTYVARKNNLFSYSVQLDMVDTNTDLILYQSYSPGWTAYEVKRDSFIAHYLPFITGKKINTHVRINNWANGWKLESNSQNQHIVIIFWPQYLEFAGFGLIIIILLYTIFIHGRRTKSYSIRS